MSVPRVAVIVVNWRSEDLLLECLRCLEAQTCRPQRILVFDNSPGTPLARVADRFPDVEVLAAGRNVGFAAANNRCLERLSDSEYVCLLNPDAFPEPGWLAALTAAAAREPACAAFASLVLRASDPSRIDSAGFDYRPDGIALQRFSGLPLAERRADLDRPQPVFGACGAAAMYRRDALVACGGFDETLFAYYEDVDLGLRLRLLGHAALLVPDAVVLHAGGGTTGGPANPLAAYYGQRNFILAWAKNMPRALILRYLPLHLLAILRGLARGLARGQGLLMARATLDALRRLGDCRRARRALHRARRLADAEFRALLSGVP